MALSQITINRGQGGLGRPLTSNDHISGFTMPFVNANLPAGFTTTDRIKIVYSIAELEALGVAEGATNMKRLWYHVNQFFLIQPNGKLYVQLTDSTAITYLETVTLQHFANGEIKQIAYYDGQTTFAGSSVTTLQTGATTLEGEQMPVSILYTANMQATSTLGALPDMRALAAKNVSVIVGEDGASTGAALAVSEAKSLSCIGTCLGVLSLSAVHENIGWIEKFNLVQGLELDEPAFTIGTAAVLVKTQTNAALTALNDYGYIFTKKQIGINGTYFNDSPTAIAATSDYAYIESNRTIDKAIRGINAKMLPNLNSPLYVTSAGLLTEDVISKFKNDCSLALESMDIDGEISAFKVTINPLQNVLSTGKLSIGVKIVPVGVARQIEINIGFAVKIS